MQKKITSLHISARRWFNRTYGNTYHSVIVYVNNEELHCPYAYGYGDSFMQTAEKLLNDAGYDLRFKRAVDCLCSYHLREELHGTYSVTDVQRKKDL